jgi:hypothetical protein
MAAYYVWHAAAGAATGANWANAFVTLRSAMTGRAAGDVFYVADDHAETFAGAITNASPGTEASPCFVYCVDRAGSVPPIAADLRTTATITTTGAANIIFTGMVRECYGITFNCGTGATAASITIGASLMTWRFVNCALNLINSGAGGRITLGISGAYTILENTTVSFSNVVQAVVPVARVSIRCNTIAFIVGATIPTMLFIPGTAISNAMVEGADLSNVVAGKSLVHGSNATSLQSVVFKDCRLGGGSIMSATPVNVGSLEVVLIRCDEGDVNYRSEKHNRAGSLFTETTVVRSGGATDGVTPVSYKIVAGNPQSAPFEALPISFWNETVGSPVTVALHAISSVGITGIRTNDQIWMEVSYLSTSGFPLSSRISTGVTSTLQAPTTYPASSETWGGTDGVDKEDSSRFYMSVTFTPQEKGPVTIHVMRGNVGAGGSTYIDPKPVIS